VDQRGPVQILATNLVYLNPDRNLFPSVSAP
jgi:hypothetical protein